MFVQELAVAPIAFLLCICAGQTTLSKVLEPQSVDDFFYFDQATQGLKALPAEHWKAGAEQRGLGRNLVTKGILIVSGTGSPFRIGNNDKTEFIFKTEDPERAELFQFTVKKKQRQFEEVRLQGKSKEMLTGIPVNITKFGESSYKLIPQAPLGPGQYALMFTTGRKIFTFGVGP
jgi:hypothetical protein